MTTLKAGCFLINKEKKAIALVHRQIQNDYSFPKGHLEKGESLKECALRETAEETKRDAILVENLDPIIETYTTPKGETCRCYMYFAFDNGKSDNTCEDTHDVVWIKIENVSNILTYPSLKKLWEQVKNKIIELLK